MNRTSTAATTTHVVSTAGITSLSVVAASMDQSVDARARSVIRPAYRIRSDPLYGGRGGSAPAEPVVDERLQLLRRVRQLDLLHRDGCQRGLERRLAIDH